MKKIFSIFIILIMMFSLAVPAFAFDSSNLWNDVVDMEIYSKAPEVDVWGLPGYEEIVHVGAWNLMLYDEINERYVVISPHGVSYGASFYLYSNVNILKLNKMDSDKFSVYCYPAIENPNSAGWGSLEYNISLYDVTGLKLVKASNVGFSIDDKFVSYDGVDLQYDGSSVIRPTIPEVPEDGEDGEDISNSGLLGGIKDFFSDVFQLFLDLIDFIWEIIKKIGDLLKSLYETLLKIPDLISSIDSLFGEDSAMFSFLDSVFPEDNENAQNCKFIVVLMFSFGLFMFFYTLIKKFLLK